MSSAGVDDPDVALLDTVRLFGLTTEETAAAAGFFFTPDDRRDTGLATGEGSSIYRVFAFRFLPARETSTDSSAKFCASSAVIAISSDM